MGFHFGKILNEQAIKMFVACLKMELLDLALQSSLRMKQLV